MQSENVIIITLDSCRWDSFQRAKTVNLKQLSKFSKAYSQGTYTLPSHISIYSGILPSVREDIPLYNRFNQYLFRINVRPVNCEPYFTFPCNTKNIITGFQNKGYNTFGTGSVSWFKHEVLTKDFENFFFSGIDLKSQISFVKEQIGKNMSNNFFSLINIGETHEPFEFGNKINESVFLQRERMKKFEDCGFETEMHKKQIKAVDFIDNELADLFSFLRNLDNNTLIVLCGDHGECFGEDGLYGHGFYHPKVMEVPLGIFKIKTNDTK